MKWNIVPHDYLFDCFGPVYYFWGLFWICIIRTSAQVARSPSSGRFVPSPRTEPLSSFTWRKRKERKEKEVGNGDLRKGVWSPWRGHYVTHKRTEHIACYHNGLWTHEAQRELIAPYHNGLWTTEYPEGSGFWSQFHLISVYRIYGDAVAQKLDSYISDDKKIHSRIHNYHRQTIQRAECLPCDRWVGSGQSKLLPACCNSA